MAKILFITSRFPYPLNKGDKLRVYFQIKYLARNHEIYLVAIDEKDIPREHIEALSPFCKSVHVFVLPFYKRVLRLALSPFKKLPLQVAFFYDGKIKKKIERLARETAPDHIHCHLIRTTEFVKNMTGPGKSLDFMDAFGIGMEKREAVEPNVFKRILYAYEKNRLYDYEAKVFGFMDTFCIISGQDKNAIRSPRAEEIRIIPNGVDFESFFPREKEKTYDILFMGNLGYPPNINAIAFITDEIMPLAIKHKPDIKLLIAGIDAPKHVRLLQSENIDVIEHFDHIGDSIAMSKIMLAPMKISIGLQNKILQAMAMKTPCIVSTSSNKAIHAPNGKAVIEADTADEFCQAIMQLLHDDVRAREMGEEGYRFVKERYSWERQNDLFVELMHQPA